MSAEHRCAEHRDSGGPCVYCRLAIAEHRLGLLSEKLLEHGCTDGMPPVETCRRPSDGSLTEPEDWCAACWAEVWEEEANKTLGEPGFDPDGMAINVRR